jgi:hypothetical protein
VDTDRTVNAGVQRIGCSTSAVDTDRTQSIVARFYRRMLDSSVLIERRPAISAVAYAAGPATVPQVRSTAANKKNAANTA